MKCEEKKRLFFAFPVSVCVNLMKFYACFIHFGFHNWIMSLKIKLNKNLQND